MKTAAVIEALSVIATAYACAHGHDHIYTRRLNAPLAITPPSRPLEWGDINIIHTTDSHGWLLGHQKTSFPEPNYSGDLGEFASFVAHMKELALKKDVDLWLVDSGDLHDGTGLTDGFPPGGVDAHDANKFFSQLPYDLLSIGNHELYIYQNTLDMGVLHLPYVDGPLIVPIRHLNFAPKFKGRYLSSNVNITLLDEYGNNVSIPVGERYAKFKTRKGRQITSFGVLYDFTDNAANTTVQKVEDMVKEQWFTDAIKEEPDLFLLVGHMPIQRDNWPLVFNAVRAVHPYTPIIILGGHTHVRDCVQLDARSMSLESGRYMETVGWMFICLLNVPANQAAKLGDHAKNKNPNSKPKDIKFSRRYLDPNRVTYEYHTRKHETEFDTAFGMSITTGLKALATAFDLDFLFGTAPHDYTINRDPYPSEGSSLSLFAAHALPVALTVNNSRASIPNLIITNSGSQRFDIYAGPFTKNDQLTASPFADKFLFIPGIKLSVADAMLASLNNAGAENRRNLIEGREATEYGLSYVDKRYKEWLRDMDRRHGVERRFAQNLTLGYVTTDSCPGVGDDTVHAPLPFFDVPDFIASDSPAVSDDIPIDLVFVDFIESQLIGILNTLQTDKVYTTADTVLYTPVLASEALGIYAQSAWT